MRSMLRINFAQVVFDRGLLLGQLFLASITASDRARDRHGTLVVVLSMKTSYGKDRSEEEAEAPYAAAGLGKYVALFVLVAGRTDPAGRCSCSPDARRSTTTVATRAR